MRRRMVAARGEPPGTPPTPRVGPELLHRLRWRNFARVAAVVAVVGVVGVVVAWPRVGPPDPRLPGPGVVPLVEPAAGPVAQRPLARVRPGRRGRRPPRARR